jgi:hypothetical protein
MQYMIALAIGLGLSGGALLAYRLSTAMVTRLGVWFNALRAMQIGACLTALAVAPLALYVSMPFGTVGGGWGEYLSQSIGLGMAGVPIGLALSLALVLAIVLCSGALIGMLLGALIALIWRVLRKR